MDAPASIAGSPPGDDHGDARSPPLDAFASLSAVTLRLLRLAREAPPGTFLDAALEAARQAIRFDRALCASASFADAVLAPHSVHAHGMEPGQAAAALAAYDAVKDGDWVARAAIAEPGRAVSFDASRPPPGADPAWMAFNAGQGIRQAISVMLLHPVSRLAVFVSLYRAADDDPFDDADARMLEAVAPVLSSTWDLHRLHLLDAGRPQPEPDVGTGLADRHGVLHVAGEGLSRMLRLEWPDWVGPSLPGPLAALVPAGGTWKGKRTAATATPGAEGFALLRLELLGPSDRLSPRETEIARLWAQGTGVDEIARRVGLRRSSVRNRIQGIYLKLGVHDKADLLRHL